MLSVALKEGNLQAANYFIAQKYLEALTAFATSPNQKTLILPIGAAAPRVPSPELPSSRARPWAGGHPRVAGRSGRSPGIGRARPPPSGTGSPSAAASCCWGEP